MPERIVDEFINRLEGVEAGDDASSIAELFSDDCEIGNVTLAAPLHGQKGAREFWSHYQSTLGHVRSVFKNRIVSDDRAALEWSTENEVGDVRYEGVSIIEHDGTKISRFFAYFDPAKLGNQLSERQHG